MAAATDKIFANISLLKSEKGWPVWKFQDMHTLKAAEYWDFVTGNTAPASQGYESKKQKAFSSILHIPAVMNCADPKELWDMLCQFERKTVSNKVYILKQLYGLHMKKGKKNWDHIRHLDELSDQLAALVETVKELNKVPILLRSVQESYPTLVTALLARKDEELELIYVKQALMDEEQRKAKGDGSGDSAFKAKHHPKHRKSVVCFNCGIAGHYQRDCHKPPKRKQQTHQKRNKHRAEKAAEAVQSSESDSEEARMFIANDALRAADNARVYTILGYLHDKVD